MLSPALYTCPPSTARLSVEFRLSRVAALLILLASPALVRAQFQEPTQEELKMTAEPKAPGASAIYLYREEVTDNPNRTLSYYVRIKVLAEKGKELATVSIPYEKDVDKVTQIEGRTIHADGSVVPLTAKSSDLMAIKTKDFQENSFTFTLPSAEVGSILEYRLKIERSMDWEFLPTWRIQTPYFIRKAHYSFRPGYFANLMYSTYVGTSGQTVQNKKDVSSLDITDVPPEPSDDWMPPINTLRWRVEFFSTTGITTGQAFWDNHGKTWAESVNEFTKPTGKIKDALAGIIAPTDSDEQKAQKIYAAVMKLENTAFTRQKSKAERKKEKLKDINKAEDIWKQQAGSDDGIALLYVALARAAGLQVKPMKVVDRNRAMFDFGYLSTYQFDDFVVMLQLGGQKIYLDPGQKMCPFRSMSWKHTLATGMLFSEKSAEIATTPSLSFKESVVKRAANLNID